METIAQSNNMPGEIRLLAKKEWKTPEVMVLDRGGVEGGGPNHTSVEIRTGHLHLKTSNNAIFTAASTLSYNNVAS